MAPEPEDRDEEDAREAPALDPDDLDIGDDEHVRQLDDNRYVVSPDDPIAPEDRDSGRATTESLRADADARARDEGEGEGGAGAADDGAGTAPLDDERVHDHLKETLATADTAYAFDVTARFDDSVGHHRLRSDDVVAAFESLLLWSARQLDDRTAAESVLGILLTESNLAVRYPPGTLAAMAAEHGVEPEDTVADLLAAAGDEEGVVFPPPGADVRRD
ncbi:MAG: hypothetical protein ABEH40_03925 [Haloferacaceae archaeon]